MAVTYVYLPVGTREMLDFADHWNADLRAKGAAECPIICNSSSGFLKAARRICGDGMLRMVGALDTLFVIAHGDGSGSRRIGAERSGRKTDGPISTWTGGVMKSWTAPSFAEHLQKEGLRADFIDLRIFACGSGLAPRSPEIPRKDRIPFAEGLFRSMRKLNFARVEVSGYLGSVRNAEGPKVEYVQGGGFTLVPISEAWIKYA